MLITEELKNIKGLTYSMAFEQFKITKNNNLFEEIIDRMMLDGFAPEFAEKIMSMPLKDKRMAILSLLDRDRNLFLKIKALINTKIGKMDHIKDVILMLREYVKVGEVEKKKFGEVMTPLELVKEMLATLPEEVWFNPNLKWLDPANGTGPYPTMVIYRLMNGLKEWEPNEEKRYKHIVENMIYVCELQPKNMFLYMCAVDPWDIYKLNIYTGSFLEKGFEKHMKEVWNIDKFDIVIGNPPYNDGNKKNFYIDFFNGGFRVMKSNGILSFITPSRYVIQPEFLDFRMKVQSISKSVLLNNTGRIFGENASFSTVYTTIQLGNGCVVDWISGFDDPIIRKVLNSKFKYYLQTKRSKALLKNKEERDSYNDEPLPGHKLFFVNSKGKCKTPYRYLPFSNNDTFIPKVYMTEFVGTGNNKTLGKIYTDYNGDIGLGTDTSMYLATDDCKRQDGLKIYLSSKLITYILNKVCQSSHANQTMILIPDPTMEIEINNENDIYQYFKLTNLEIHLINESVSKQYV